MKQDNRLLLVDLGCFEMQGELSNAARGVGAEVLVVPVHLTIEWRTEGRYAVVR